MKRWLRSHPLDATFTSLLCVCWLLDCFSSVPTKKKKSAGSSPESHRNQTELTTNSNLQPRTLDSRQKGMPNVRQPLRLTCFLYKLPCNFILESLWIPGTSILRYNIWRLTYGSKRDECVKILYVQLNCSMLLSALGCVRPPFCRMIMQRSVNRDHAGVCFISCTRWSLVSEQRGGGVGRPVLLCLV